MEVNTRHEIPSDALVEPMAIPFSITTERPGTYTGVMFTATNNESCKAAFMAAERGLKVERFTGSYSITRYPPEYTKGMEKKRLVICLPLLIRVALLFRGAGQPRFSWVIKLLFNSLLLG